MGDRRVAPMVAFAGLLCLAAGVHAHDWYPRECCGDGDCAPADNVVRRDDGSYLVTSRGMSIVIPADYNQWRVSPDARLHVCIRKLRSGSTYLVCAFRSPGT